MVCAEIPGKKNRAKIALKTMEKILLGLMPSTTGFSSYNCLPSVEHCIGKQKLLGEYYAEAMSCELGIHDFGFINKLQIIACLLRAYIVLDDYAQDSFLQRDEDDFIRKWSQNVKHECMRLINDVGEDSESLWKEYEHIQQSSYKSFNGDRGLYWSIINKCALIFLPFSFRRLQIVRAASLRRSFERYLFLLQIMDDFQDIEEDLESKNLHNIFYHLIESNQLEAFLKNRCIVASELAIYLKSKVEGLKSDVRSDYLTSYYAAVMAKLTELAGMAVDASDMPLFSSDYEKIKLRADLCLLPSETSFDLSRFRAEFIHSV